MIDPHALDDWYYTNYEVPFYLIVYGFIPLCIAWGVWEWLKEKYEDDDPKDHITQLFKEDGEKKA